MVVIAFERVWLSLSLCGGWLCRIKTTVWFSSPWYNVDLFFENLNKQNIYDNVYLFLNNSNK